jgi:hypothetical protein
MSDCPEIEAHLTDYVLGELDAETAVAVSAHAEQCPACTQEINDIREVMTTFGHAFPTMAESPSALPDDRVAELMNLADPAIAPLSTEQPAMPFLWSPALKLAAAVVLACGISAIVMRSLGPSQQNAKNTRSMNAESAVAPPTATIAKATTSALTPQRANTQALEDIAAPAADLEIEETLAELASVDLLIPDFANETPISDGRDKSVNDLSDDIVLTGSQTETDIRITADAGEEINGNVTTLNGENPENINGRFDDDINGRSAPRQASQEHDELRGNDARIVEDLLDEAGYDDYGDGPDAPPAAPAAATEADDASNFAERRLVAGLDEMFNDIAQEEDEGGGIAIAPVETARPPTQTLFFAPVGDRSGTALTATDLATGEVIEITADGANGWQSSMGQLQADVAPPELSTISGENLSFDLDTEAIVTEPQAEKLRSRFDDSTTKNLDLAAADRAEFAKIQVQTAIAKRETNQLPEGKLGSRKAAQTRMKTPERDAKRGAQGPEGLWAPASEFADVKMLNGDAAKLQELEFVFGRAESAKVNKLDALRQDSESRNEGGDFRSGRRRGHKEKAEAAAVASSKRRDVENLPAKVFFEQRKTRHQTTYKSGKNLAERYATTAATPTAIVSVGHVQRDRQLAAATLLKYKGALVDVNALINAPDYDYAGPVRGALAIHHDFAPAPIAEGVHVLRVALQAAAAALTEVIVRVTFAADNVESYFRYGDGVEAMADSKGAAGTDNSVAAGEAVTLVFAMHLDSARPRQVAVVEVSYRDPVSGETKTVESVCRRQNGYKSFAAAPWSLRLAALAAATGDFDHAGAMPAIKTELERLEKGVPEHAMPALRNLQRAAE